jgi:imidazolonepropionase-like amidohydrolase
VPWKPKGADPERNLESYLYSGVTTVFDTGEATGAIFKLRDRVDHGEITGPGLYVVGKTITAPDGHPVKMVESLAPWWIGWFLAPRVAYQIDSAESARAAVIANRDAGADFIKVVVDTLPGNATLIEEEVLKALVEAAHENDLRVVTHIGSTSDALMAGRAGVDLYVHGVYMDRIPDEDIATIAGFGIPMVPTVVVFDNAADINQKPFEPTRLEREVAPEWIFEAYNENLGEPKVGPVMTDWLAHLREVRPDWDDNISRLHEAGVTMFTGSDFQPGLFPGPSLHRELDHLHEAGLPTADVLRAATINPARFLTGSDDPDFGTVQPGKRADLVLVEGNPLAKLSAVHNIQDVIVGGVRLVRTGYPAAE